MSQDKNILEKLFDGDYSPFDTIEINDEKYLQILDSAEKEHNFFNNLFHKSIKSDMSNYQHYSMKQIIVMGTSTTKRD